MRRTSVSRRHALRVLGGEVAGMPFIGGLRGQRAPANPHQYDLETDPHEAKNLANDPRHTARKAALKTRMAELRRELGDVDPPGPPPVAPRCHDGQLTGYPPRECVAARIACHPSLRSG